MVTERGTVNAKPVNRYIINPSRCKLRYTGERSSRIVLEDYPEKRTLVRPPPKHSLSSLQPRRAILPRDRFALADRAFCTGDYARAAPYTVGTAWRALPDNK